MNSAVDGCLRNPACVASTPGDEAIIPWLSRAVDAARTAATLKEFLDAAEVARVERILIACAKEADFQVNEREYGPGKHPDDAECDRVVRYEKGEPVRRRMELGTMKHELAFICVRRELLKLFPDNISVEPRYRADPAIGRYALTDIWKGSLKPDIVLHLARNAGAVQCVYDFKFPCTLESRRNPLSDDVLKKLMMYGKLGGNCKPAIVTPQFGIGR